MKSVNHDVDRRTAALTSVLRVFSIVLSCVSMVASSPTVAVQAAAEDPHWTIEMPADGPANVGDPFVLHLALRLVGPPVGTFVSKGVSTMYSVMAIRPDGTKRIMYDHATQQGYVVGSVERIPTSLSPRQNGEWTFRVEQYVGDAVIVVAETHMFTDKVAESVAPAAPVAPEPQVVGGLRVDRPQPVVGLPATIVVEMGNWPQVPVELIDDDRIQQLGTVANPGAGGAATLVWVPQQMTEHGLLRAGDQSTDIVVLEAPAERVGEDAGSASAADSDSGAGPDR